MASELRIIRRNGRLYGFKDGARMGISLDTVLEIFEYYYGAANHTERHTFEKVENRIADGMCLWLFGNREWWFARIGGVEFEHIETDILPDDLADPQFSSFAAISFSDYSVGASRVNWTDAIARLSYEYEDSVWWRDIHNAGTGQ